MTDLHELELALLEDFYSLTDPPSLHPLHHQIMQRASKGSEHLCLPISLLAHSAAKFLEPLERGVCMCVCLK